MSTALVDVTPFRVLVVDDERPIHATMKLRLGPNYEMISAFSIADGLAMVAQEKFDLCITDLHMAQSDGFSFIERAREMDPALGYVIISAFDTGANLRRAIPLQVFDFLGKPLPSRDGFEQRLPAWIERTRRQRHELALAGNWQTYAAQLADARLAQSLELVASESARDSLLEASNLLTTINAHLVNALGILAPRVRADPVVSNAVRNLESARRAAEVCGSITETFFNSAYANRDTSPAYIASSVRHAIEIGRRNSDAIERDKIVDFHAGREDDAARGLSWIQLLSMLVPLVSLSLESAQAHSTVRIDTARLARLDAALTDQYARNFLWVNRRNALAGSPAVQLTFTTQAESVKRSDIEAWLNGEPSPYAKIARGSLRSGLQKAHALLGLPLHPTGLSFRITLVLPV